MELSLSLTGVTGCNDHAAAASSQSPERQGQLVDALHAVAAADGEVSDSELTEISAILTELDIPQIKSP